MLENETSVLSCCANLECMFIWCFLPLVLARFVELLPLQINAADTAPSQLHTTTEFA